MSDCNHSETWTHGRVAGLTALLLFASLGSVASAQPLAPPGSVGVNLTSGGALVNLLDQSNRFQDASAYDANGWPMDDFSIVVMDGRPGREWTGVIDDPDAYRAATTEAAA